MLKGLYSGRKIKATPGKLTRTQTGKQALNAIVKKYGKIIDSAKYMHKGKGNWVRYSIENDRKRTGKITTSLDKWREQPHKLDYRGKDTKGSGESSKRFAISSLKSPAKPKRRTAKTQKMKGKPTLKTIPKNKTESTNKKILADLKKHVTDYLNKTNSKNIKIVGSVSNPVIGDIKYTSVKYKINYQNGYPAYLLRNELDEIEKKVRSGRQNILFDRDYKRTFTAPMWNFAINAFLQEYPGSDMKTAKKRALRDILDYQINKGVEEAILKDPLSKKRKRAPSLTLNDLNRIPKKVLIGRKAKTPIIPKRKPVLKNVESPLQKKRLRLLASMVRIARTTDQHNYYEKWDTQLRRTFKDSAKHKKWKADHFPILDNDRNLVMKLAYVGIVNGENVESTQNKKTTKKATNEKQTTSKADTFDLKSNPDRKEFVSDYTGITDRINRRTKRVEKIRHDIDKGTYKDADTRRHEASHKKYTKRADKLRNSTK